MLNPSSRATSPLNGRRTKPIYDLGSLQIDQSQACSHREGNGAGAGGVQRIAYNFIYNVFSQIKFQIS